MNTTENVEEKTLERVSEKKPVSVYSVNFTHIINNNAEREFIEKAFNAENLEAANSRSSVSKMIFRWRSAIAIAAIFTVGILHFAFQISVIRREVTENRPAAEVPPVKIEQLLAPSADNNSVEFEAKKADVVMPEKNVPRVRRRQPEIIPARPALKKKEAVENRAGRLRRAERILTGV